MTYVCVCVYSMYVLMYIYYVCDSTHTVGILGLGIILCSTVKIVFTSQLASAVHLQVCMNHLIRENMSFLHILLSL